MIAVCLVFFSACVPARKYQDEQARAAKLSAQKEDCLTELESARTEIAELKGRIKHMDETIETLREDSAVIYQKYQKTSDLNKNLNDLYEKVITQNKDLLATSSAERQKLAMALAEKERELDQKEKRLNELQASLNDKEKRTEALQNDLRERERRVNELESILSKKDSAITALKNNIAKALLSFDEDELTVEMRNGKIYVSLAEQLLFKSGSITVDPKGRDALGKLAEVLKKQKDIDIMIEGHTDDVPIKTASIKDNWDLSVLRATSIARILTEGSGVDPERIVACGRGEFMPVAPNETKEGRAKNRRTEIILAPNLDEVFKIIGQ